MSRSVQELWDTLHQAGLAENAAPTDQAPESPWYVKLLLAFSGGVAAFFLLGSITMEFSFILENSAVSFITGVVMIGAAFALLRAPGNPFFQHLALAGSLAGQALVIFVIFDTTRSPGVYAWLGVFALEVVLAAVIPDFVHRVFSSFIAAVAFTRVLTYLGYPHIAGGLLLLAAAFCWLREFRYPLRIKTIQAAGYGLVLTLILFKATHLTGHHAGWLFFTGDLPGFKTVPWMGEALIAAAALCVVWHLLGRYGQAMSGMISISAMLAALLVCIVSMKVQGLTVGMVILLLGFAGANRVLMGLGIVSLLFYISAYYYLLHTTLLIKSLTLLAVGLLLLSLRGGMLRMIPAPKEKHHV